MARAEKEEEEGGERGTAPFTALVIEEAEATEGGREKVAQKKQVFPQPYILTMLLFSQCFTQTTVCIFDQEKVRS